MELGLFISNPSSNTQTTALEVRTLFKDNAGDNIFFLNTLNLLIKDQAKYFDIYFKVNYFPKSLCHFLTAKTLAAGEIDDFYSKAKGVLLGAENRQITRAEVLTVTLIPFENVGARNMWAVEVQGMEGKIIIRLD
jgi:hypothetical protein